MTKVIVVLISWLATKQLKMIALATSVAKLMLTNVATFATPDVSLTALTAAAKRLQDAYNGRKNGDAGRLEYKNAAEALDVLLHSQATYVNGIAKGNSAIIVLSGFTATSNDKVKKTKTDAPGPVLTVTPGGGVLDLGIKKVKDAASYIFVIFLGVVGEVIVGDNYVRTTTDAIIVTKGKLSEIVAGLKIGTTVTVLALTQNAGGISAAGPATTKLIN